MSNPSRGKKSKPSRPASKKNLGQNLSQPFDGAYGNPAVVHTLLSLMGKNCQTKVRNGGIYEGIFHTFNPKMDLALSAVHMSENCDQASSTNGLDGKAIANGFPKEEELIQEMVFLTENLVSANFEDVDLNFAALDVNETNGESMSHQRSSAKAGEKKLEPWNGGGDTLGPDPLAVGGLESSGPEGTNGWDAAEMFKANKEKYGVVSNYDASLSSYTMPLEIKATEEDSERVARATRIAQEIESGNDYKHRINLELDDGVSEEDKFSAVTRDRDPRRDGRGPRDMRDRDGEYGGHRGDKDRGDRDHPSPAQGQYRANKHSDFDQRFRNSRGRARDPWRNPPGYSNPNIPPSRSVGPGAGQSGGGGGGRNQPPLSQMDGPPGQGGQSKPYRGAGSTHLPPRFTKSGSGGHSRDEERMRPPSDSSPMHAKAQRQQQRIPRSSGGRWPPTPAGEYPHHSPTQMHPDPAVISSGPAGASLSRTSSSSSNTSAPVQNHRKAHSTSSQEEQSQHSGPHHQHIRQPQSSSSPTGGPVIPNTHQAPPRLPGMHPGGPSQTGFVLGDGQELGEPLSLESSTGIRQQNTRTLICPKILKRQAKSTDQAPVVVHASPKQASPSLKSALKSGVLKNELPEKDVTKPQRVRFAPKPPHAKRDLKFDQISRESGCLEGGIAVPEDLTCLDVAENECMSQTSYIEQIVPVQPIVSLLTPNQIHPFRLTVAPPCQRPYHHPHTSGLHYLIIHNSAPGVLPDASAIVQTPDAPGAPNNSWASAVIRGNQKAHNMGPVATDMQQPHVGHISPSGLAQQPSGSNKIQFVSVPPNVTLSWTPSPASRYAQQGMAQPMPGGMNSPRGVHPNTPIQTQMMPRAHPQAQQNVITSPPQPQVMPTQQSMQAQHQQQMSMPQRVAQPPVKTQSSAPPESVKPAEKSDDSKPKKPAGPSQALPISIKSRNEGQSSIKELQEFRDSFKLSTNVNKDQPPMSNKTQQRHQPNVRQQQPSPVTPRLQPPYPNPTAQQQPYKHQAQQQHPGPYPGAMIHQDHGAPHSMAQALTTDPSLVQQLNPHPQHVVHHMPHPQITQMPMASPGIQRFAGPQAPMHVSPMGLIDSPKIMGRLDKSAMQMQQRHLTSSKSDNSNFNLNGNVHVVTGQPVLQTTPSAVISVSAAPHVTSQYPAAVTVNAHMGQQRMKQSPITVQGLSPSSTPSIEQGGSLTSATTSPTAGKPLNPEAIEFKPRTSAKPVAIATRAVTPLQHQGYVAAAYQPQVIGGMGPQSSQLVYNTGQVPQFEPMQASMPPMYPQFPQQIIFGQQQLVQQIPGQPPMQQFAAFDQNGQVYAGSAPQPMMAQNARMAALPATPQQHVAQYPMDQSPGTVYVPVSAQQANFMQQARPHSATPTPTQGSHVTAASPAGQSTQAPQHATQPAPAMVQTPGAQQQQMWMMVQAQHHQHVNQPPQLAQYINAMPTQMPSTVAMTNATQQPKGQQQPMQYMGQPPPRQYAQYQSAAPNN